MSKYEPAQLWDFVERAQKGDVDAFGELYDATVEQVYRYVRVRVGHHQVAEDITADAYLRMLRNIANVRPVAGSPIAYLYRIARNASIDHYNRHETTRSVTVGDLYGDAGQLDRVDPDDVGPESGALGYLDALELWAAVRRLTAFQRDVIVLRFLHGLSIAETAEVVDKPQTAVKVLQLRGMRRLRQDPRVAAIALAAAA